MKTIEIGEHKIEMWESAEQMTMKRYHRFNKFLMIDNEVGSDFTDYNKRTEKAIQFLKNKMVEEALKELDNRRMLVFNSFSGYQPKGRALAIMVKSIDGEEFKDFSSSTLDKILDKIEEIEMSQTQAKEIVDEVKKKSKKN